MYVPKHFEEKRIEVLHALMKSHPLAAIATVAGSKIQVSHIPLWLDPGAGPFGTLRGHVARANPLWEHLGGEIESLAIFQGPQAYVSPSWYASKQEDGKVVPTWDYVVVHAHGRGRAVHDAGWLRDLLSQMTDAHESRQAVPWKISDAPADYIDRMLEAIVGIEIPISTLQGSWKTSQNRALADRMGVAAGLLAHGDEPSRDMAALVMPKVS